MTSRIKEADTKEYEQLLALVNSFDACEGGVDLKQKLIVSKAACKIASGNQKAIYNSVAMKLHAVRARDLSKAGLLAEAARHYAVANIPEEYAQLISRYEFVLIFTDVNLFWKSFLASLLPPSVVCWLTFVICMICDLNDVVDEHTHCL
jgi:hypothetical protein